MDAWSRHLAVSDLKLSHIVGVIAEDFGWEVDYKDRRSTGGKFDRIKVHKEGKKNRSLFFDGETVFICQSDKCDHDHPHEVSIHDPLFEEVVRSWFPFFEDRDLMREPSSRTSTRITCGRQWGSLIRLPSRYLR